MASLADLIVYGWKCFRRSASSFDEGCGGPADSFATAAADNGSPDRGFDQQGATGELERSRVVDALSQAVRPGSWLTQRELGSHS